MGKVLQTRSRWSISKKQKREYGGINELPDEVLSSILSHMSMKEAASTSILSRRWEKLWSSHPCLVFDGSRKLRNMFFRPKQVLESERVKYVDWVNDVLESHSVSNIDEFILRFDLDNRYQSDIDQWVRFAFGNKVKRFQLDLYDSIYNFHSYSSYELCSRSLGFHTPTTLTSIILRGVSVSGKVLENLISNNLFLQYLCVTASISLVNLRVAAGRLTHLEINCCVRMKSLELDAPNLSTLRYHGQHIEINFIEVPNLVEISLQGMYVETCDRNYILPPVATFAPKLHKLVLMVLLKEVIQRKMKRLVYPIMNQLKELELVVVGWDNDSLLCLSSLINACPSLDRLSLELSLSKSYVNRKIKKIKSPHYNLKVVEITGFVGRRVDTEFCMYLIENAVMLEKMSINHLIPSDNERSKPKRKRVAREQAEHLRSKYGLGDKLVILS